jgi:hypothetical protein
VDPAITPDPDGPPTLAEELSAWRAQHPRKTAVLRPNTRPVTVKRVLHILYFELLNVWVDWRIRNCESHHCNHGPWIQWVSKAQTSRTLPCRPGFGFLDCWRFFPLSLSERRAASQPITDQLIYRRASNIHGPSVICFWGAPRPYPTS